MTDRDPLERLIGIVGMRRKRTWNKSLYALAALPSRRAVACQLY